MSDELNHLHALGINPFSVVLLAESMLKSQYVKHCGTKPLTFNFPIQRSDCAGWLGVRVTIEAVPADAAIAATPPQAEPSEREKRLREALFRLDANGPMPGMAAAFENYFGQTWADPDWRNESSVWACAWRTALAATPEAPAPAPVQPLLVELDYAIHHGWPRESLERLASIRARDLSAAIDAARASEVKP